MWWNTAFVLRAQWDAYSISGNWKASFASFAWKCVTFIARLSQRGACSKFYQEALGWLYVLKLKKLNKTELLQINFSAFHVGKFSDNTIHTDFPEHICDVATAHF